MSLDLMAAYLESSAGLDRARTASSGAARPASCVRLCVPRYPASRDGRLGGSRTAPGRPGTADIPVVVASVVDDRARGLALGAAAYLLKPVGRDDLLAVLSRVGVVGTQSARSRRERRADPRGRGQPGNLKLVRDVLGAAGYDVVAATTGEDGLGWPRASSPDLVLMDLQLPGIDGVETMRRLGEGPLAVTSRWSR